MDTTRKIDTEMEIKRSKPRTKQRYGPKNLKTIKNKIQRSVDKSKTNKVVQQSHPRLNKTHENVK